VPAIRINSRSRPVRKGVELLELDETSRLDLRDAKRSLAIDPAVETSLTWTASKSPLSFQVRRFRDADPIGAACGFFFCSRSGLRLCVAIEVRPPEPAKTEEIDAKANTCRSLTAHSRGLR
jgi:hypothetical protein